MGRRSDVINVALAEEIKGHDQQKRTYVADVQQQHHLHKNSERRRLSLTRIQEKIAHEVSIVSSQQQRPTTGAEATSRRGGRTANRSINGGR